MKLWIRSPNITFCHNCSSLLKSSSIFFFYQWIPFIQSWIMISIISPWRQYWNLICLFNIVSSIHNNYYSNQQSLCVAISVKLSTRSWHKSPYCLEYCLYSSDFQSFPITNGCHVANDSLWFLLFFHVNDRKSCMIIYRCHFHPKSIILEDSLCAG